MSTELQAKRDQVARLLKGRGVSSFDCAHEMFEHWSAGNPDRIALASDQGQMSYGELERRSNQLAHYLRNLGVGPDVRIGIYLNRGPEMVLALLGVLKAGAAYVPLDPGLPVNRIGRLIDGIQLPVIITEESLSEQLPSGWAHIVSLDTGWPMIAMEDSNRPSVMATSANLAYVLYTSGSTGMPKGVEIEHRNLVNYVSGVSDRFGFGQDVYAMVSTFGADLGNTVLFGSLCRGGTLHIIDAELVREPKKLGQYFERHGVDVVKITPSHLGMLLGSFQDASLVPLKTLVLGGEASDAAWVASVQQLRPQCRIWNHYGPTETTVGVLTQPLSTDTAAPAVIALGRPLSNVQAYVLDDALELVRPGLAGELYVGGSNVSRGYYQRPRLTAERFVPDPFGSRLGGRLYHTGDMVRWLADGTLEFLGRVDDQIKLRGFRIEPGEIEAALLEEPGMRQARVILREDNAGDAKLVGYVVADAADFDAPRLRAALAAKLPDYMVPSALARLDVLPLTSNGKLDRKALPKPKYQAEAGADIDARRSAVEEILAGIWAEVLHVEQVGRDSNFFELGGHSLLATQAVSRVRSVFGIELPLQALFDQETLAGLAGEVERTLMDEHAPSAPPLVSAGGVGDSWPLSFAQQRLWFIDQLDPGITAYNIPRALRLNGNLNVTALRDSLSEIVRRHSVLRTRFPVQSGQPVQRVDAPRPLPLPLVDLSRLGDGSAERTARGLALEEYNRAFDLESGPLIRCRLLRIGARDHILLATMHHIVTDAWSTGILVRELTALYEAYAAGRPSSLPELPVQYTDFAVWQRNWLQGEALDRQLRYWRTQLAGLEPLELPIDHSRPSSPSYRGEAVRFRLDAGLSGQLQAMSRRQGVTLFMTLLAALQLLLARYSGQDDIVVGSPIAGRNRAETENLIGFFVNTLVLRTNLSSDPSFTELLGRVRKTALAAFGHQDIPFEQLVDEVAPVRDLSRHPLFQVVLVLQNDPGSSLSLGDLTIRGFAEEQVSANFDLGFILDETPMGLSGTIAYATDLFESSTIERMAGHLQNLLARIVASPDARVSDLSLLTDIERDQLLAEFNDTRIDRPVNACAHELFERHAAESPNATALVHGGRRVTYGELNARSNRLAHYLQSRIIGLECRVGVCLERSVEMVEALLAILKAGAAYVPLDPAYPADRLAFMVADSGMTAVLTDTGLASIVSGHSANVIRLDHDVDWSTGNWSADNPDCAVSPENLAYIIYTSGSTGMAKGTEVPHRSIPGFIFDVDYVDWNAGDVFLHHSAMSWDALTLELWTPLLLGACCVLYSGASAAPEELGEAIQSEGVSVLWLTSTLFNMVVDHAPHALQGVRRLLVGGEALSVRHVRRALDLLPRTTLINGYGPSECTVFTCCYEIPRTLPMDCASIPIGRAIGDRLVLIVDGAFGPAPIGVPGELCVAGPSLARGYVNRPELTADRFVPAPNAPGIRMYRTGDLVRRRADGLMEFVGRVDDQVKVRGFRIEMGEIEAVLSQHQSISAAVVVAHADDGGHNRLAAYVVAKPEQSIVDSDLRAFLKVHLPEYMVPSAFVILDALPLTPTGKIDRKSLLAPRIAPRGNYAASRTSIEETLAGIWANILGLERVGIYDNFFEIGGDSILSIQIVARANQAGIALTPRLIFQHQTVAELAAVCGTLEAPEAEQGLVTGSIPLTPIQQWFFEQPLATPHHFNQSVLLETDPRLTVDIVREAVRHLAAHHDALRIRFVPTPEGWLQDNDGMAEDNSDFFSIVDLSGHPGFEQRNALEQSCNSLQANLDLQIGPLFKVRLFTLGPDQPGRLLIVAHHLIIDGVSWRILLEDLPLACAQLLQGESVALPAKSTSFQQWSEHLHKYAQSVRMMAEEPYWAGLPWGAVKPLPVDTQRAGIIPAGVEITADGGDQSGINVIGTTHSISEVLSADLTRALLQEAPEAYHTQINDILLAALAATLCRWMGCDHVLLALEGHGREDLFTATDVSRTIGWFTSIFPIFLHWTPETQPGDLLIETKEMLRGIPEHGVGYGLLRYLAGSASLSPAREPEVSFNYLGQFDQTLAQGSMFKVAAESGGPEQNPRNPRAHLLDVNAVVVGGQLRVTWTACDRLHGEDTLRSLAVDYIKQLQSLVAHCISPGAGSYTPSDYPEAKLSLGQLRGIMTRLGDAEPTGIYPLSPLQQGLLFHALYSPGSGEYVTQALFDVSGGLDVFAFRESWQQVVDRHDILRTAFFWEELSIPLQVVRRHVDLPVERHDWSRLPDDEQERRLQLLLKQDAEAGFDVARAPLMRLTVISMGPGRYRVLWTHHHLLLDGWCLSVLFGEVLACYQAALNGEKYHAERPRPYREYIQWLCKQDMGKAEDYWRKALAGFDSPTPLPDTGMRPAESDRHATGSDQYGERSFSMATDLSERAAAFAQQHQITLNTLIQGCWSLLLSRYSGQDDVLFGATVSGRPPTLPGVETMLGLFINTLPVRIRIHGGQPVFSWLQALQAEQAERSEYEYSPLSSVHGWSKVPRDAALFESLVIFENYPVDKGLAEVMDVLGGLKIDDVHVRERTNYPIAIYVNPGNEIELKFRYQRARYTGEFLERMVTQWRTLLSQIVASPESQLDGLSLLTDAERHQILVEFNNTGADCPLAPCMHQSFEEQAARTPEAVAVVFEGQKLAYSELNARANQLAHYLRSRGVGPEVRVGLLIDRSLEMVVGLLGILKAGGVYVPLDPAYPADRLAFVLEDARARILVTRENLLPSESPAQNAVVCLDRDRDAIGQFSTENVVLGVNAENLAYVIYTSGSTGKPKGVSVTHGGLQTFLFAMQHRLRLSEHDTLLSVTTLSFDIAGLELYLPLILGARVVIASREVAVDGQRLANGIADCGATVMQATPSTWQILIESGWGGSPALTMLCGGEALGLALAQKLMRCGAALWNMYGPTETTIWSLMHPVTNGEKNPSIGQPIVNTVAYVLDDAFAPCPVGVPGELYIGGAGLARGYLNRPGQTAERFLPNPFAADAGARLYRTGDLCRWGFDGNIEYLGRIDYQVKIRGFRIELGEIETALTQHPGIISTVVIAWEDNPGDKRLVAYIVASEEQAIAASELRTFLKPHLPEYMVPASYVFLHALPLTPNGKIDRKALPAPDSDQRAWSNVYEAPENFVEVALADIWRQLLRNERVGRHDNFFDLGGHSILATRFISQVREQLGVMLDLRDVFTSPTIALLADLVLEELLGQDGGSETEELLAAMEERDTVAVAGSRNDEDQKLQGSI